MPVTRPLLSCSPFLSFQSALRASGQSCAQCPWFLDNLHFVQPEKVMFIRRTQSTFVRCSCCPTTASCISLSPSVTRACSCLFIQRLALRLSWTEKQSRSGRISMHPAGLLGRCVFGGAGLTVFSCGKHKHISRFWWCRHIQIDFHTFHFSFLLTFCTFHFSFLLTFCTCFFFFLPAPSLSQPSTSFSQQSTVCSHF